MQPYTATPLERAEVLKDSRLAQLAMASTVSTKQETCNNYNTVIFLFSLPFCSVLVDFCNFDIQTSTEHSLSNYSNTVKLSSIVLSIYIEVGHAHNSN